MPGKVLARDAAEVVDGMAVSAACAFVRLGGAASVLGRVGDDPRGAAMREALPVFGRQIADYDHPDVVMTGVETRTSSPVRFTRGPDFQSLNTAGLFPAGEGAGYAGGIMSAGVDGIEVAEALAADLLGLPDAPVLQGKGSKAGGQV